MARRTPGKHEIQRKAARKESLRRLNDDKKIRVFGRAVKEKAPVRVEEKAPPVRPEKELLPVPPKEKKISSRREKKKASARKEETAPVRPENEQLSVPPEEKAPVRVEAEAAPVRLENEQLPVPPVKKKSPSWLEKVKALARRERKKTPAAQKGEEAPARPKKKLPVWQKVLIAAVSLVAVLAVIVVLFVNGKLNKLNYNEGIGLVAPEDIVRDEDPNLDSTMKDLERRESAAALPEENVFQDKDVVNILLLGTDIPIPNTKDLGRCDATLVCSLNKKTGEVKLVSFERAIGVPIPNDEDTKLNAAYKHGGGVLMQDIITKCFLVDLAGYVHVSYENFPKVIDALGGIDMELDLAEVGFMREYLEYDKTAPHLEVGMNHLNGSAAYAYARMREYSSDWKRQGRVRNVVQASLNQVKTLSVAELNELADTILPMVGTNLTKRQITSLIMSAPQFVNATITQLMIPEKGTTWSYGNEYNETMMGCDYTECAKKIKEFLYG